MQRNMVSLVLCKGRRVRVRSRECRAVKGQGTFLHNQALVRLCLVEKNRIPLKLHQISQRFAYRAITSNLTDIQEQGAEGQRSLVGTELVSRPRGVEAPLPPHGPSSLRCALPLLSPPASVSCLDVVSAACTFGLCEVWARSGGWPWPTPV